MTILKFIWNIYHGHTTGFLLAPLGPRRGGGLQGAWLCPLDGQPVQAHCAQAGVQSNRAVGSQGQGVGVKQGWSHSWEALEGPRPRRRDGPLQQVLLRGRLHSDWSPASLGSLCPGASSCVTWALAGDPASLFWASVFPRKK